MRISTDPNDPRVICARQHPELNLQPPVLDRCAEPGCVNTVIADEQPDRCPFHR